MIRQKVVCYNKNKLGDSDLRQDFFQCGGIFYSGETYYFAFRVDFEETNKRFEHQK